MALFAEAQEALPSSEFMQAFLAKMEQARRRQNLRRIALVVAACVLAAWIMPSVLTSTAAVVKAVGEQSQSYGLLVNSPAGWAVSMLIAFFVLFRTGALRRH
jgi:ferric-dicitrate binding protein FerR (iron transport regulator)